MPGLTAGDPKFLEGYTWAPAYWATRRKERGLKTPDKLPRKPKGILIHSGANGRGTAQWAWRAEAKFWAHFAFDSTKTVYVQTDYLDSWCPHGGGLNQFSWGVETAHYTGVQNDDYKDLTVALVEKLVGQGAEWVTCHKFIEPTRKFDPGSIVTADWFAHLPLRMYWNVITIHDILEAEGLD